MPGNITSANAVYTLGVPNADTGVDIFAPTQLQGFSAEDIFTTGPLANAELLMGLDGLLSAGFIYVPVTQNITLQADSDSNDLFDNWYWQEQAAKTKYAASATILLPAINKKWAMIRGFLSTFPPMPDAARTLRPRRFAITWNAASPANM